MKVDFYQLGGRPVEQVLPAIAQRLIDSDARLLVVSGDEAQQIRIDAALWTARPDSFLPHARTGMDEDAAQPILISATTNAPNAARNIALADGAWRDEALEFDRVFHFFDAESVEAARGAWRGLNGRDGVERRYWVQDDAGKWSQMA
jgi:DNA polymerase-3 subunit chi